jgi:transcriptional regulator with XRE-family HTH domain
MEGMHDDLAKSLRAWRDRLDPAEAGLPRQAARRAPGLRREEVAALAGISVNYLVRLEQGRATSPSPSVVSALARALRLDAAQAEHLHRLAGHADPTTRVAARHLTPSIQRILDRLEDVPVIVVDAAWTIVAGNPLARAFLGGEVVGENAARRQFVGPKWIEHEPDDAERFERDLVGDLHRRLARHPDDPAIRALIDELNAASERFAALWAERPATFHASSRKTVHHRTVGTITVDCDVLEITGTDLRVVIWTAAPGSPDASALALLGVVGLQPMQA